MKYVVVVETPYEGCSFHEFDTEEDAVQYWIRRCGPNDNDIRLFIKPEIEHTYKLRLEEEPK